MNGTYAVEYLDIQRLIELNDQADKLTFTAFTDIQHPIFNKLKLLDIPQTSDQICSCQHVILMWEEFKKQIKNHSNEDADNLKTNKNKKTQQPWGRQVQNFNSCSWIPSAEV